MLGDLVD